MSFWGIPVTVTAVRTNPMDTDISTVETIQRMIALVRLSAVQPLVVNVVNEILSTIPSKNPTNREIARAIYSYVKRHVTFCEDESILASILGYEQDPNQELLIAPITILQMPQPMGDCDDFSMLTATLLKVAHIPCWFVAIAADDKQQFRFSHVFVVAYLADEGKRVTLDTSHGDLLGWEYKVQHRRAEWLVS